MSKKNVILVAESGPRKERYLQELEATELVVDSTENPGQVFKHCTSKEYSGLLLDFATMMKSHGSEKQELEELSARLPTLRLQLDPARDKVVGLLFGQKVTGEEALDCFVEKCGSFNPIKIRSCKRQKKILSVLIYDTNKLVEKESIRANTTNISQEGGFITTLHPLKKEAIFWIRIKEFELPDPIRCEVCWIQPWGVEDRLPGVGVNFSDIPEEQQTKIESYLSVFESMDDSESR